MPRSDEEGQTFDVPVEQQIAELRAEIAELRAIIEQRLPRGPYGHVGKYYWAPVTQPQDGTAVIDGIR